MKMPNGKVLTLTPSKDPDERLSLYHNKTTQTVRVLIKKLIKEDFGNYMCFPANEDSSEDSSEEDRENTKVIVQQGKVPRVTD